MGFFVYDDYAEKPQAKELKGYSLDLIHREGCNVCPLNDQKGLDTPNMDPMGSTKPIIYMLGEMPSRDDDYRGKHFAGKAGAILRNLIPPGWLKDMRWNHVVRTHYKKYDAKNDIPHIAVEACRPSVIADIEKTKPFAIFGFGAGPLKWAADEVGIRKWAGRYLPVTIGKHTCWFFPMLDPSQVLETRKFEPRRRGDYGSDDEFWFQIMVKTALETVDTLPDAQVDTEEFARKNIEYVTGHKKGDLDRVLDWLDRCYDADEYGFDYETNRLRPYNKGAKILTVGLALEDAAFSFPLDHPRAGWTRNEKAIIEREWVQFIHNAKGKRLVHNVPFEAEWTGFMWGRRAVIDGNWECTQSQAYILDERTYANSLDFVCRQRFGLALKDLHKVDRKNMEAEPLETCLIYNAADAKYHRYSYFVQRAELKRVKLDHVYDEHMKRQVAAALTHLKGVPIDPVTVEKFYNNLMDEIEDIEIDLFRMDCVKRWQRKTAQDFHPANNNHVIDILREEGFKELKLTKDEELDKIDHPFADIMREWRKPTKLLSTYILPVRKGSEHLFDDGYLHPIINCTKTRTWRTSSEDPNIQNWPKRGDKVYIRKLVKPLGGTEKLIVAIDYGGMQARNVAMESLDPELCRVYRTGYDIHGEWRNALLRKVPDWLPVEKLGPDTLGDKKKLAKGRRDTIKNKFVFPCFFGAHETSLSRYLGVDVKIAGDLRAEFFDKFRTVERWHNNRRDFYAKHGYITGHSGFHRRAPIALNQLINAPIQGDEAFIVCNAWHRLATMDDPNLTPTWMIHDDLTFIWEKRDLEKYAEIASREMLWWSAKWQEAVPLEIEISIGTTWNELEKWRKLKTSEGNQGFEEAVDADPIL